MPIPTLFGYPSNDERRITVRLLAYWEKRRGERPMPHKDDIVPEDIHDLWDHCFVIHVNGAHAPDYHYHYLGEAIRRAYLGGRLADDPKAMVSLDAARLEGTYEKVIKTNKPMVDEGEFRNLYNEVVRYRQCLMPLGENGKVHAIFGGMRFKIFPAAAS